MSGGRRTSRADARLIAAVEQLGVLGVTARKLERWRQAGCLPPIEQRSLGRSGTVTAWPPGTAAQVVAVVRLLAIGVALAEVPLALFYLGFPVRTDVLRSAYVRLYGALGAQIREITDGVAATDDPLDRADALAQILANRAGRKSTVRQLEPRLRRSIKGKQRNGGASARSLLADVLTATASGLVAGQVGSSQGIADALIAFGLNDGQDVEQTGQVLARLSIDAVRAVIDSATPDQWAQVRRDCHDLSRYIRTRRAAESALISDDQRLSGLDDLTVRLGEDEVTEAVFWASLTPVLLVVSTPEWRAELARQLDQFDTLALMLSVIPDRFHHLFGLDHEVRWAQATEADRDEVISIVSKWAKEHPVQAERVLDVFATA